MILLKVTAWAYLSYNCVLYKLNTYMDNDMINLRCDMIVVESTLEIYESFWHLSKYRKMQGRMPRSRTLMTEVANIQHQGDYMKQLVCAMCPLVKGMSSLHITGV